MLSRWGRVAAACVLSLAAVVGAAAPPSSGRPLTGFTVHWDFLASASEAERLVAFAIDNGAEVVNVVPPPHIWEDPASLSILRRIFAVTAARGVGVILSRIDGSSLPGPDGTRTNWLYTNVLTEPGRLPSGGPTPSYFLATVGNPRYERWLREETAFYAERFSGEPNLLAFGVGMFNEPFVSQRGSLLCFEDETNSYEVGQYTHWMADLWRRVLARAFSGDLAALNRRYRTAFTSFDAVPMPKCEADPAFGDAAAAYLDFVSAINTWVVDQLEACRSVWHARASRPVPFILQLSGYVPEKFALGRPAFAALDIFDWMRRTDALGVSLYTDCGYPDGGRASVAAMVNFLRLGAVEGKPVFVMEGGNECDGAILDADGLDFFAGAARALAPRTVIYEFLKTSYAEAFATSAGKLLGPDFRPRPAAVAAVRAALRGAKAGGGVGAVTYVLDEPPYPGWDAGALALRLRLARAALKLPLTFVPEGDVGGLPPGSTLVVPSESRRPALQEELKPRGITVTGPEIVLTPVAER